MKRLFLSSFLVAFGVALAIFFVNMYWRDRVIANGEKILQDRAWTIADTLDFMLQRRMTQVFAFAALPSTRGLATTDTTIRSARAAVALSELQSIVAADPNVRAASILDTKGIVILTTDASMLANWSERPFAREALRGQVFASPTTLDSGEISQYYSAPILNSNGDVAGAFVLRVSVQEFWNVLSPYSNVRVVDEYGVRLADRSQTPLTLVALAPLSATVTASALNENRYGADLTRLDATNLKSLADAVTGTTWNVTYREMDGRLAHATFRQMKTYRWNVIVFDYDDVLTASVRDFWMGATAFGIVVSIVAVSLGWILGGMRESD